MPRLTQPVIAAGSISQFPQPTIDLAGGYQLRPWKLSDTDAAKRAFSDPDIQRWHVRRIDSDAEATEWIKWSNELWDTETGASWAIAEAETGAAVGRVAIYLRLAQGDGEVTYWVLPEGRQKGLATAACIAATSWAHDVGIHRVELQHSVENQRSRRVALASGFAEEGTQRGAMLHADGWHDGQSYSHLATDQ